MKAMIQGELDGLCGVYSIVNALRVIQKIGYQESRELFSEILKAMESRKKLSLLIEDGMNDFDMGFVYRDVVSKRYPIRILKPYHNRADISLGCYWDRVQRFLSGGSSRAVNLVVEGFNWGHWTVVYRATPNAFHVLDSDTMCRLDRKKCTTRRLTKNRTMLLWPTMTRFLFRKQLQQEDC